MTINHKLTLKLILILTLALTLGGIIKTYMDARTPPFSYALKKSRIFSLELLNMSNTDTRYDKELKTLYGCIDMKNSRLIYSCYSDDEIYNQEFSVLLKNNEPFFNKKLTLCVKDKGYGEIKGVFHNDINVGGAVGPRYSLDKITSIKFYNTLPKEQGGGGILCTYLIGR